MKSYRLQRSWRFLALFMVVFLSACAGTNTFTVQQEVFQQFGGAAPGGSYAIKASDTQNIERSAYANLLQQNMYRTGLYQASSAAKADYLVDFKYSTERREQLVRDYYPDPFFFYPYMSFGYWPSSRFYGGMMFHPNLYYGATVRQVNYNYYSLQAVISRRSDGQNVYQSTVAASSQAPLVQVMPYLMAAVFDGYPGQSAGVREVVFDLDAPGGGLGATAELNAQKASRSQDKDKAVTNTGL
ncbi:hypothetical protein AAEX37_00976 [Oligella sp. MSHR50489EDL]|uniref:DUF4136 domain-containing protein n=1 Tax=Oligella sp. MSHR50489EDL TaxID=3139409 RepID=UPI003D81AC3E